MAKVYLTYANGTTPIVKAREVKVAAPFDVRTVVDSYEDLYDNTVFERSELYLGMPVITLDTYDIYILTAIPGKKQTSADAWAANIGWKKIGSGSVDPSENLDYYNQNAAIISNALDELGIYYTGGKNAPYIWLKCPNNMSGWEFFNFLLENAAVVGTPGEGFGKNGKGYFRLTSFGDRDKTVEAVQRLQKLLS